ncbi:helix-turn-helix transcriptional regulator [Alkalispirochaeta americana]|uniref:helix-turn-helix transcriptional regulator n=1 Tax=Alkalispirochaeta americana TaxID=159291 RepID=UPI00135662C8|nr:helix-turn-helix transcriptional regulator [Alkalispirochaeta americana]
MSSFVYFITTIGIVNSFLFAFLSWKARASAREYRHAGTWLSLLFLCFGIALARLLYREFHQPAENPFLFMAWLSVRWIYGPALLFYVRSVMRPGHFRGWRDILLHSIPFILHFIVIAPLVLYVLPDLTPTREDGGLGYLLCVGPVLVQVLHFFCYVGRMNTELFEASLERVGNQRLEAQRQAWILTVVTAARVTTAVFLALTVGYAFFSVPLQIMVFNLHSTYFPFHRITAVYMFLLLHYTGYKGLDTGIRELLPRPFGEGARQDAPEETEALDATDDPVIPPGKRAGERSMNRYVRSSLSLVEAVQILARTRHHVEVRERYLDPELTLDKLAGELTLSRHSLSQALNQVLQQNFSEFINSYRLQRAQELLRDQSSGRIKLIDVAFASGFRSKSSFNALFKRYCSMTPTEYRKLCEEPQSSEEASLAAL